MAISLKPLRIGCVVHMSANERTGWRDEPLSKRHREWGCDCPAVDIDFLMIEYDRAEPKCIVEYKNQHAMPVTKDNPSIKAMAILAHRAGLPAFVVRYADDFSLWKIVPLNKAAEAYMPENPQIVNEHGIVYVDEVTWVKTLYTIRGRELPESVRKRIESLPHRREDFS